MSQKISRRKYKRRNLGTTTHSEESNTIASNADLSNVNLSIDDSDLNVSSDGQQDNQMDNTATVSSDIKFSDNWSIKDEIKLLYAALDNKPLGLFKHIQWALITEQFVNAGGRDINSDELQAKYGTWYNLEELDKREPLLFDNSTQSFTLPAKYLTKEQIKQYKDVLPEIINYDAPAYVIDDWDDPQIDQLREEIYRKLKERRKKVKKAKRTNKCKTKRKAKSNSVKKCAKIVIKKKLSLKKRPITK